MLKPYYSSPEGQIFHGHALDVLRSMGSESVQMCVTSPPYWGLRDYGLPPMIWDAIEGCEHAWGNEAVIIQTPHTGLKAIADKCAPRKNPRETNRGDDGDYSMQASQGQFCQTCEAWRGCLGLEPTPELYISHMVQIFRELKRVLRNDGTLWLNMGDSYFGGGSSTSYGNDTQNFIDKSTLAGTYTEGQCSRPIKTKTHDTLKTKDLCGIPWMLAFALRADGWYLRSDIIWHKPNPMPESVTDRPTKAHEYIFLLTKSAKYFYDNEAIKEPVTGNAHARGSGVNPKAKWKTPDGWDTSTGEGGHGSFHKKGREKGKIKQNESFSAAVKDLVSSRNKRTVWTIPTQPMPQAHFATFPEKLIEPCILAGTSERGCCVECGGPWERIIEKTDPDRRDVKSDYPHKQTIATSKYTHGVDAPTSKTIGWQPTCKCKYDHVRDFRPVPCTVMDIFGGAMTTAIVAHKHGRKFVMIELSQTYIDEIGIPRIEKATKQKGWNRFK